jgi:hypothetical protein
MPSLKQAGVAQVAAILPGTPARPVLPDTADVRLMESIQGDKPQSDPQSAFEEL